MGQTSVHSGRGGGGGWEGGTVVETGDTEVEKGGGGKEDSGTDVGSQR